ncbi:TPA: LysR family transcriptional regulator [Klebsiella pneumoniae]
MKTLQYSFAQIEAFATIAETGSLSQAAIRLAKDRTTLRDLLDYLEDALGYRLFSREGRSLTLTAEAEQALSDGVAEMAICQANNRTLGSEMEWRALGTVDLRFYAADSLFHDAPRPLTLLNLSLTPQLVMHRRSDDQIARRLQISGHTLYMNEITLLRHALEQGRGWGFLPDHLRPGEWQGVSEIATEVGSQGLNVTMVMLWLPGMNKHRMLSDIVHEAPELWQRR